MKKLLLLAAGTFLALNVSAATWKVVGLNNNWEFSDGIELTGSDDELTCEIDEISTDFKIVDTDDESWAIQFGAYENSYLALNTVCQLVAKTSEFEPKNIFLPYNIQSVKDVTVKFNPTAGTIELDVDGEIGYRDNIVVTGKFNDWTLETESGAVACTVEGNLIKATVDFGTIGGEFKLSWTGNWDHTVGGGVTITAEEAFNVTYGGDNLKTDLTGEQNLVFNVETMAMTFGDASLTEEPEEAPTVWAVVGAYTDPDWNFEASTILEGEGDVLSCTIDKLTNDFKIVNITYNNWDEAYSISEAIELGKTYVLSTSVSGNISFADLIQEVNNATVTWNPTTFEMTITAASEDVVKGYPTLYFTGSLPGYDNWPTPGEEGSIEGVEENGVYTFIVDLGASEDVQFKIAGSGWSNEIGGGVEVGTEPVAVTKGGDNLWTTLSGEQTLIFNYEEMTMYFEAKQDDGNSGDEGNDNNWTPIEFDETVTAEAGNIFSFESEGGNCYILTDVAEDLNATGMLQVLYNGDPTDALVLTVVEDENGYIYNLPYLQQGVTYTINISDEFVGNVDLTLKEGTFTPDTDGVKSLLNSNEETVIYNLQGVRVNYPEKGIYIINGKKVSIK